MIFIMVIVAGLAGGFVYALVTHLLLFMVSRIGRFEKLEKFTANKTNSFLILYSIYAILITILSFVHLEKKGYGDFAKLPVGNGHTLLNIDGASTTLETLPGNHNMIDSFSIAGGKLCAKQMEYDSGSYTSSYIVFNTANNDLQKFSSSSAYEQYARDHQLPLTSSFRDFYTNHQAYWSKHESWWLPFL